MVTSNLETFGKGIACSRMRRAEMPRIRILMDKRAGAGLGLPSFETPAWAPRYSYRLHGCR